MSEHGTCQYCGADKVLNPKTGKVFCSAYCWLPEEQRPKFTPGGARPAQTTPSATSTPNATPGPNLAAISGTLEQVHASVTRIEGFFEEILKRLPPEDQNKAF